MKTKDLMVDDHVQYNGTITKVENIHDDCINFVPDIPYVQEEFFIDASDLRPIEVTPEILEKNGFELSDSWYIWINGEDKIMVHLPTEHYHYAQINYDKLIYNSNGVIETDYSCQLIYKHKLFVHHLQNFIKLVEVNKNIEL